MYYQLTYKVGSTQNSSGIRQIPRVIYHSIQFLMQIQKIYDIMYYCIGEHTAQCVRTQVKLIPSSRHPVIPSFMQGQEKYYAAAQHASSRHNINDGIEKCQYSTVQYIEELCTDAWMNNQYDGIEKSSISSSSSSSPCFDVVYIME